MRKRSTISCLLLFLFCTMGISAQTYFQKVYTGSYNQEGQDVLPTSDGGYLIAGYTTNSILNDCDIYILKADGQGNKLWTKTYGGAKPDFPYHMIATGDGNYFLIGYSQSYGGGDVDIFLMKIDPSGNLIWQKTYGTTANDEGRDIIATSDGNYVIVGMAGNPSNANLIKIDPAGNTLWNKTYGAGSSGFGDSVKQCSDGGYIMLGETMGVGNGDAYLVRTDANGNVSWTKTFGGPQYDEGVYVNVNPDNSYTFLIRDSSNAGMDIDVRITNTDQNGNQVWSKVYGGTKKDTPKMLQPTSDGGYIAAAISRSFNWIQPDMWIMKFTNTGDTTWTRHYGGVNHEHCYAVKEQADGSYIAIGKTDSYGPDMDIMFLKLNNSGTLAVGINETMLAANNPINLYPNPGHEELHLRMNGFNAKKISITNSIGQEVYQRELNNEENLSIKLAETAPGIYFLKTESENQSVTTKFIIN